MTSISLPQVYPIQEPLRALSLCKASLGYLAYLALKVASVVLSCFGAIHSIYDKFNGMANRTYVVHYLHNRMDALRLCSDPQLLSRTLRNMATREVIATREDELLASQYLHVVNLENCKPVGASRGGICFGATLYMIKEILERSIASEGALISLINQFHDGFPKEAAAIQILHGHYLSFTAARIERDIKHLRGEALRSLESGLHIDMEALALDLERYRVSIRSQAQEPCCSLLHLDHQKVEGIDQLLEGIYQIQINTKKGRAHAIVFFKTAFGAYFIDPNYGLERCERAPSEILIEIGKKYNKSFQLQDAITFNYKIIV